jgi:hypothetical protein
MQHPAELKVHQYIEEVRTGKASVSEKTIDQITNDVRAALVRQFVDKRTKEFSLRMSNAGRPLCQLWFDKNEPEKATTMSSNFLMNMMIGDIVEAVFKGILTEAGVVYSNGEKVTLKAGNHEIQGTPDLTIDGAVDDVKSASDWSYKNKFVDYKTLAENDSFGYVAQLAGYAKAMNVKAGGWWVINKAKGEFKYVPATGIDVDAEVQEITRKADALAENKRERCFEPVAETYRGKPTGNLILGTECSWCSYRYACWDTLEERPSLVSRAEHPPMVSYVKIAKAEGA